MALSAVYFGLAGADVHNYFIRVYFWKIAVHELIGQGVLQAAGVGMAYGAAC
jgi:hypothetical protein